MHAADLALKAVKLCRGERQTQRQQPLPLLIGQQPARRMKRREHPLVRTQHEQHPRAPRAKVLHRADRHLVHARRDRTDLILRQQHPQRLQKRIFLHRHVAEHQVHLLQRAQNDLIELPKLLRRLRVPGKIALLRRLLKRLPQPDRVQKFSHCAQHFICIFRVM